MKKVMLVEREKTMFVGMAILHTFCECSDKQINLTERVKAKWQLRLW